MKAILTKVLKSKWVYVAILAIIGLVSGGAYGEQITQMILSLLGQ